MRMVLAMILLLGSGCASARYVSKSPNEGVVAMPCDNEANRQKAEALMASHFPEGYVIVREEEAPVGTVTHVHKKTRNEGIDLVSFGQDPDAENHAALQVHLPGVSQRHTDATYTTKDKTEWRIHYRKKPAYLPMPSGDPHGESLQQHFDVLDSATPQ